MRQVVKLFVCGVFCLLFLFLVLGERPVGALSGGPDPGNTGAPGERTCSDCHIGGPGGGILQIGGLPANYTFDQEVTLTVTLTQAQANRNRFGFQATVIDDTGKAAGTLIVTDQNRTQLRSTIIDANERQYVEHTSAGTFPISTGTGSWTFRWKAPATNVGRVTFYVAGNAADGSSTTTGDTIYTTSASATAAPTIAALASVSAASFASGAVSPNSIVAAFAGGEVLAAGTAVAEGVPLPEDLLGTTVRITDSAGIERGAGLFFVSPGQINLEIPGETGSGMATVKVVRNSQTVAQGTVQIDSVSPGIFRSFPSLNDNSLAAAQIFRVKADGSSGIENIVAFDGLSQFVGIPIEFGPEPEVIFLILYGTGIRGRSSESAVTATIAGIITQVAYAGPAPGFVGLDQINLGLSRQLVTLGNVNVVLTVDGKPANTVIVNVK